MNNNQFTDDIQFMHRALELAELGQGKANPNPLVGAVIVKDDKIIGEGYHKAYGDAHAEINAFNNATECVKGATLYVTLEPCSHHGKTPPCVDAVIANAVSRVVISSLDPNPKVSSIKKMEDAGIEVTTGVLNERNQELNETFFHYIKHKTPYVVMKYAMTLDGKIATKTGASKWITGEVARHHVHETRNKLMGIMVGVGTVLADDPMLDCRISGGRNPVRIIVDTTLKTPMDSRIIETAREIPTIIATLSDDAAEYEARGVTVIKTQAKNGKPDLQDLMAKLGERGIDSILLEGGATLNASALEAGIVHKVQTYVAPKIFAGGEAPSPVAGLGINLPSEAYEFEIKKIKQLSDDVLIESVVKKCSQE